MCSLPLVSSHLNPLASLSFFLSSTLFLDAKRLAFADRGCMLTQEPPQPWWMPRRNVQAFVLFLQRSQSTLALHYPPTGLHPCILPWVPTSSKSARCLSRWYNDAQTKRLFPLLMILLSYRLAFACNDADINLRCAGGGCSRERKALVPRPCGMRGVSSSHRCLCQAHAFQVRLVFSSDPAVCEFTCKL